MVTYSYFPTTDQGLVRVSNGPGRVLHGTGKEVIPPLRDGGCQVIPMLDDARPRWNVLGTTIALLFVTGLALAPAASALTAASTVDVRDVDVADIGTGPGVCVSNEDYEGYAAFCRSAGRCDAGVHWNLSYPARHVGTCGVWFAPP